MLERFLIEYVFLIDVPFDTLIERCTGRLLCTTCDYIGNTDKGDKIGDKCEEGVLYQREDDKEEVDVTLHSKAAI